MTARAPTSPTRKCARAELRPTLFTTYNCTRELGLTVQQFVRLVTRAAADGVRVYKVASVYSVEPELFLTWRERQP